MGLDIRISRCTENICPHCGKGVGYTVVDSNTSGGRLWYPFLESIGYYVPYDKRTEENDWYGKDMALTTEQAKELFEFLKKTFQYSDIKFLVAMALAENDTIVINADW